jgi:hypothetical protein
MKRGILGFLLAAALFSSPAFAAQNVANTSQKGSLLIFPLIDVRTGATTPDITTTIVDISNDQNLTVNLNCNYINDKKGRVDFHFNISPKGSVSFDVLTHSGSIAPPPWPTGGTFPQGNALVGELICFAVDGPGANQVRFNHLTGTATVVRFDDADANQTRQAFKYNAWAFTARSALAVPPPDNSPVGTPGTIVLSGGGDGTYDACPQYLIANFSPGGIVGTRANVLGGVTYRNNFLSISSCFQDLTQDFTLHLEKLQLTVWNEFEEEFSGAYQCSDSVLTFGLETADVPVNSDLSNFTYNTLGTHNARFEVDGIPSSQCAGTEPLGAATPDTGNVGVLVTSIGIGDTDELGGVEGKDAEIGNTIHGAGLLPGFILWNPNRSIVPEVVGR